jgi:hypothetical protein
VFETIAALFLSSFVLTASSKCEFDCILVFKSETWFNCVCILIFKSETRASLFLSSLFQLLDPCLILFVF